MDFLDNLEKQELLYASTQESIKTLVQIAFDEVKA